MVTATMILKLATRFVLLVLAHLITVPTYVVWMLLLRPLRLHPATRALYWQVDTLLMKGVHVVVAYWIYASGYISQYFAVWDSVTMATNECFGICSCGSWR